MGQPQAYGNRPTPHCLLRVGRDQLSSALSIDVTAYAIAGALLAALVPGGYDSMLPIVLLTMTNAAINSPIDSFNRCSDFPGPKALATG